MEQQEPQAPVASAQVCPAREPALARVPPAVQAVRPGPMVALVEARPVVRAGAPQVVPAVALAAVAASSRAFGCHCPAPRKGAPLAPAGLLKFQI
ncbi:hypothetical protein [Acidisoma sp.]|uniref:hypothetical protein n=1 Tax=Acidisoma sp. TaxID=1872115 RepID=UPI003AFFBF06